MKGTIHPEHCVCVCVCVCVLPGLSWSVVPAVLHIGQTVSPEVLLESRQDTDTGGEKWSQTDS